MNKILLLSALCLIGFSSSAQTTATDFTSTDCDGTAINLFSELNSGKVIVMCWVMPCGACQGPGLTTMNVVNSYMSTNPHTVYMYVIDDYANTSCALLENWKNNIGLVGPNTFSDASIEMADYGIIGMPKIVVVAGGTHTIFYNVNDVVNPTDLQAAINAALQVIGVDEQDVFASSLSVFPNPATEKSELQFSLLENSRVEITLLDMKGAIVKDVFEGKLAQGKNKIGFSTSGIAPGTYLVKVSNGTKSNYLNLVIAG
jgi:hypothetical protein